MTDKRPSSAKVRRECFEANRLTDDTGRIYLKCHICNGRIDPVREPWEAEHTTPHAFGGTELKPAHVKCHKVKTADDVGKIAKSKRVANKHFGTKTKPKGRPLAGTKASGWKHKINGDWEKR